MGDVIKVNKEAREDFEQLFEIEEDGLYLIEIIASAKNWLQNWKLFFDDDDLAVKIDNWEFSKLNGKNGLMNGEAGWNGNNLKGLKKLNIFIVHLKKGKHKIEFIVDGHPFIETVKITRAASDNFAEYVPSDENRQAQDGDRRQWITIAIADLPLQEIEISAKAEKREKDRDDIKLIIDGKIQENKESEFFKNWYWRGSSDEGKMKVFKKNVNLQKGLHYIELWADRMPILEYVKMRFYEDENLKEDNEKIMAKAVWEIAKFRSEPRIDEENVLGDLEEGDEVEIIERALKGDSPRNAKDQYLLSNRWHKVNYNGKQGYVYSEALEIDGESADIVKSIIKEKARELAEDENLMLAIAEAESVFQPYRVSYDVENFEDEVAYGIMQITPIAIQQVEDDYQYKVIDKFNLHQNIEGGIRYFQYLRTLYNSNGLEYLEKLLISYNCGAGCISGQGKIDYSLLSADIKEYVKKVKDNYKKNKDDNQAGLIKIYMLSMIGLIFSIVIIMGVYYFYTNSKENISADHLIKTAVRVNAEEESKAHYIIKDDLDNDEAIEQIEFNAYFHKEGRTTEVIINERSPLYLRGYFIGGYTIDVNNDGIKDVIIELAVGANGIWTEIYSYKEGELKNIPVQANTTFSGFLGAGIKFVDYDDDGDLEVEAVYRTSDICKAQSDIYEYIGGQFIKAKEILEYEPTCRESMKKFTG